MRILLIVTCRFIQYLASYYCCMVALFWPSERAKDVLLNQESKSEVTAANALHGVTESWNDLHDKIQSALSWQSFINACFLFISSPQRASGPSHAQPITSFHKLPVDIDFAAWIKIWNIFYFQQWVVWAGYAFRMNHQDFPRAVEYLLLAAQNSVFELFARNSSFEHNDTAAACWKM